MPQSRENENLVVRKSAVRTHANPTIFAPTGFNAARNPPARTVPISPPEGIAPRTAGMRQQRKLRRKKNEHQKPARQFRPRRINRLAAEPAHAHDENRHRQQKRRIAAKLKHQIREMRAKWPNPIAHRPARWPGRRHIKGWVAQASKKAGSAPATRPQRCRQSRSIHLNVCFQSESGCALKISLGQGKAFQCRLRGR